MCEKSEGHPLSWPQLNHAIRRNFGGLESEEINPLEEFSKAITGYFENNQDFTGLDEKVLPLLKKLYRTGGNFRAIQDFALFRKFRGY